MADPIEDLVHEWQHNPNASATVALCEALRDSPRGPLVLQVGELAAQQHPGDVTVLVSVARMYLESKRYSEAQGVLVNAGKHAPRDPRVYRWLGEVLLRRGDAGRAVKVLEKAVQLGAREPDVRLWLERARGFQIVQANGGEAAVAAEVAYSTGEGAPRASDSASELPTAIQRMPPELAARIGPSEPPTKRTAGANAGPSARPAGAVRGAGFHVGGAVGGVAPSRAVAASTAPIARATGATAPAARAFAAAASTPEPLRSPRPPAVAPPPLPASELAPMPTAPPIAERVRRPALDLATPAEGRRVAVNRPEGPVIPYPRDVLDALALSGLFEPNLSGGISGWDRAAAMPKRKGVWTLITAMALFLASTVGVYVFYRHKRALEHQQADALLASVEEQLSAGKPDTFGDIEKNLARALKLNSRSPRAALDWARERALVGLIKGGADIAFEDAMARAKEVGVPEEKYAFAHVASFLFQGDTAGAAAVLPRWDGPAQDDALYQLVAGAALARAGDGRALDRYTQAARLDPHLFAASTARVRVACFDGDMGSAMEQARALRASQPDRAEPVALVALAWGRDPRRESLPVPSEVDDVAKRIDELPLGLKVVPPAVAALRALDRHAIEEARVEVRKGLSVAEAPGEAVWLGTIALPLGEEDLARKAALSALQFSAVYEPARALAARVALYGGRLDEALKATEELDASSPDVAVVRAASAYERTDSDGVERAFEALRSHDRGLPLLSALALAGDALAGKTHFDAATLLALATDDPPWSDLVAMDNALDAGDVPAAHAIAAAWGKDAESSPLRALRLARLARYEGRLDAADALSQVSLEHATVTPRVLAERTFVLVARNRGAEVAPLLARFPLVLGPVATWLSAYATASGTSADPARAKTATLDLLPDGTPFPSRVVVAAALGAMKDRKRGVDYVKQILATSSPSPDLVAAALSLGLKRVEHGPKRKTTYE